MTRRNIARVHGLHQSLWLDNLSRRLIRSGDLARLRDLGVTGITSNPTIFHKAVAQGADYDADIRRLASAGRPADSASASGNPNPSCQLGARSAKPRA